MVLRPTIQTPPPFYPPRDRKGSYLGLDVDLLCVFVEPVHVELAVKVSDVADDGVVLHVLKVAEGENSGQLLLLELTNHLSCVDVLAQNDVLTAGGGNKDVSFLARLIHGGDLVT